MAKFSKGHSFVEDEQITHEKLNNLVDAATFASDAVDDSTTEISSGAIIVKTGGITHSQLATDSVKEVKIVDLSVSTAKIANDAITEAKIADNAIQAEHYTDGSVAQEHLNDNVISGQAELAATPHLTEDEVLISDNGTLKRLALMKYLPLPRAFGVVPWVAGSQTISTAYNVTTSVTVVEDGDVDTCQVTLSNNMSSTDYVVIATHGRSDTTKVDSNHNVSIFAKTANSFKIGAPSAANRVVNFVVFGTLA
tara:strand:- start:109 stop:864 length:756 start_codon:yes stop_codon:yes gene_type:complete